MKAIVNTKTADDFSGLEVQEVPKPVAQKGELVIKVICSGIQPADVLFINQEYVIKKKPPFRPGSLGLGEVTESNAGLAGLFMKGKKVWFSSGHDRDGTWTEYALTDAKSCFPYSSKLTEEQAVNLGNAVTVIEVINTVKKHQSTAVVLNAAAGNVGRMVNQQGQQEHIKVINIVRSGEQAEILKALGAQYILNEKDPNFVKQLETLANQLQARVFFDSVSGPQAKTILRALPQKSHMYNFGNLSRQEMNINPIEDLMVKDQTIQTFWLPRVLEKKTMLAKLQTIKKAQALLLRNSSEKAQKKCL